MRLKRFILYIISCICIAAPVLCVQAFAEINISNPYNAAYEKYILVGKTYTVTSDSGKVTGFSVKTKSGKATATINKKGELKTLKPDTIEVSATVSGQKNPDKKTFVIVKRADSIKLNYYKLYLTQGYSKYPKLIAAKTPADSTDDIKFVINSSEEKPPVVVNLSDEASPRSDNGGVTATAYSRLSAFVDLDKDPDKKTDEIYLYAHTHGWTAPYVAADSVYHHRRCKYSADCSVTDPKDRSGYSEHRFYNGVCTDCRYTENKNHTHTWKTVYTSDSENHWYACTGEGCDGKKGVGSHNFGSDNKCVTCSAVHAHNNWTDKISANDLGHWHSCLECDARKDYTPHSSTEKGSCKQEVACEVCAMPYKYGPHSEELTVSANEYSHSTFCQICHRPVSSDISGDHEFVKESDTTVRCTVCNFVHTHTWSEELTAERAGHIRTCTKQQRNSRGVVYKTEKELAAHTYGSDDLCTACGYDGNTPNLADGTYEISTAKELAWFAKHVNAGENTLNAVLLNNIILDAETSAVIGNATYPYGGTFDGRGYTVTLKLEKVSNCMGLFGAASGANIKNFTVDGNITVSANAKYVGGAVGVAKGDTEITNVISNVNIRGGGKVPHVGGVVGSSQLEGGGGMLNIERCIFGGNINLPHAYDCAGGIIGYANNKVTVKNCGSYGTVVGDENGNKHIGGILGYINNSAFGGLEGCWSATGTVSGAIIGCVRYAPDNIKNNFCTAELKPFDGEKAAKYTANYVSDWRSGEGAWKLNGGAFDGTQLWYQSLDGGSYPGFAGKTVYRSGQSMYTNTMPAAAVFCDDGKVEVKYIKKPCVLGAAAYKDGKLCGVKLKNISAPLTVNMSELVPENSGYDMVKIMLLKDMNKIEPLCPYYVE